MIRIGGGSLSRRDGKATGPGGGGDVRGTAPSPPTANNGVLEALRLCVVEATTGREWMFKCHHWETVADVKNRFSALYKVCG